MAKIIKINKFTSPKNKENVNKNNKEIIVRLHCARSEKVIEIKGNDKHVIETKIQEELVKNGWYSGICWIERMNENLFE
jgi:aminopeptidase C